MLWLFYTIVEGDESKVECNKCATKISRGRKDQKLGNGSMLPHLMKHHPDDYKKYEEAKEAKDAFELEEAKQKKNSQIMVGPQTEYTIVKPSLDVLQYYEEDPSSKTLLACQVGHCTEKFAKDLTLEALKRHLYTHWNID